MVRVEGVDISDDMHQRAHQYLESQGTNMNDINLVVGSVEDMDHIDDDCIDLVFHANSVYFWKDLDEALGEIHRVTKPGGTMVSCTCFGGIRKQFDDAVYINRDQDAYLEKLEQSGFVNVRVKGGFMNGGIVRAQSWDMITCDKKLKN